MNSKQKADRMKGIEKDIILAEVGNYDDLISEYLQEAKEIYEKFKDGCGEEFEYGLVVWKCGESWVKGKKFCLNCQRIHKSWERINGDANCVGDENV